jgi:predicted deacylase
MDIPTITITGDQPGPRLLISGGVHGDEFEPMAAIRRLASEVSSADLAGQLTLAPVVNEPAFRRGQRTAEDDRDLARTCPGRDDGSITEQVAAALTRIIRAADFYVDLHTGGTRLSVWPLVGYMLHRDPTVLQWQRRMARAFGLPLVWGTDASLNGRSLSIARDANIPSLYAEYLGGGGCDPAGVRAYVEGCRRVMLELGMLTSAPPALLDRSAILVVEDERPNSGHMQINLPAPQDGFFEPAVQLGQHVRRGERFGTVSDVLGQRVLDVAVPHDGIVIVLHTFARVDATECLGVVLERGALA